MDASHLHRCWQLLRYFGPTWLMHRAYYAARLQSGLVRLQLPMSTWDDHPLSAFLIDPSLVDAETYADYRASSAPPFFFDPNAMAEFRPCFANWDSVESSPIITADDVGTGFVEYFSHERVDVGFPPRWHVDPFTGNSFPTDRHWSQIQDFAAGDIKLVWETNRFGFVFSLVRSYWRTGEERYAELFWQLVESWRAANPPETGVNWKCGQEISLRVMAWCFGLYGFAASSASTPMRLTMLAQMMAVSARHIESNIGYALNQKNNHGLSEAMGLWTIGSLFPEFTESERWAAKGRRLLESQADELIYDDGAFSQHSMNYHRVMLHDYLWSMRLGDVLDQPFSAHLRDRIGRAGEFTYQLQDEFTGRVPCYGQDDGALILPLNNCGYRDFRPVVQAIHYLTSSDRQFEAGPWDEDLLWLFGKTAVTDRPRQVERTTRIEPQRLSRHDFEATDGGYSTLRSPDGFALTRAAGFRHRPGQADMLHVDIWWRGENIAIDPGTYSYNAPPPWNNRLAGTSCHNTVTVDGEDQMDRAGRFLWLPWLNGTSFGQIETDGVDVACWNGEHDGYRRLADPITHRRGVVRIGAEHWLIVDSLHGRQPHNFRLHWLLLDAQYEVDVEQQFIELSTSAGQYGLAATSSALESKFDVIRAAPDSAVGWRSCFYHAREPAISVSLESTSPKIVFATMLGPDASPPVIEQDVVRVCGAGWQASISLNLARTSGVPLVASIDLDDASLVTDISIADQSQRTLLEPQRCTFC